MSVGRRDISNSFTATTAPLDESPERKKVTVEEAFELVGGFGKFQKFSAIMNALANAGASFMLYAFAFLEAEPKFMCQLNYP
jgi:hypothetical protein